jgi:hypothetical protein
MQMTSHTDIVARGFGGARAAQFSVVPSSINEESRTFEITFATSTRVKRRDWDGEFWEELSLDPKHVRMERFQSGRAPFLLEHNRWDPDAHVGVIESARIVNGEGRARVRMLKDDPGAEKVWNKIRQGVLTSISAGYRVHKFVKTEGGAGQPPVYRAEDWEPLEASAVSMPADPASHIRSAQETPIMPNDNTPVPDTTEDKVRAERERVQLINTMVRKYDLGDALGARLVEAGGSIEQARAAILDALAARSDAAGPGPTAHAVGVDSYTPGGQRGGHEDFRAAATDALVLRAGISLPNSHPAARDLVRTSVVDIARTCLSRSGVRTGMLSTSELLKRAFSTSDFPQILTDAVGVSVRRGYETEPASHRQWVRTETVPDFREQVRPILGSAPGLAKIGELGEYTFGSMTEDAARYKVDKYGVGVAMSWELLVNDSVGSFLRVKPALGQAARRKEADLVYSLFAQNSGAGPTVQDGNPLFHVSHNNIADPGPLNTATLADARRLLRKQTAVGGGYMALAPRYLLIPAEMEQDADMLLAASTRVTSGSMESDRAEWIGRLVSVVEPRLPPSAYYLLADSGQIDTVILGLLDENADGPVTEEEAVFANDSYKMKVRHVFGAKALDFRGMIKVPGA